MGEAIMHKLFQELINWIRRCSLEEKDKLRIIEKVNWIREEIKIYRRIR